MKYTVHIKHIYVGQCIHYIPDAINVLENNYISNMKINPLLQSCPCTQ